MSIPNRPNRYRVSIPVDSITKVVFNELDKTDIDLLFSLRPKMEFDTQYGNSFKTPVLNITYIKNEPTAEESAEPQEGAADGENTF